MKQKQVWIDHLGLHVSGATKTEARAEAEKIVIRYIQADTTPAVVQGKEFFAVIFRDIYAYNYMVYRRVDGHAVISKGALNAGFNDDSRDAVIYQAISDLAQREWTPHQLDDFSMWMRPDGSPLPIPLSRSLMEWARWQIANLYGRKILGMDDMKAHREADNIAASYALPEMYDVLKGGGHLSEWK